MHIQTRCYFLSSFNHWINRVKAIPTEMPSTRINQNPALLGLLSILE